MSIYRTVHGLIFDEKFLTFDTDRWRTISPSNSVNHISTNISGQLQLNPSRNGRSTNVMMDLPQEEGNLLFQVYADYYPELDGEGGGIVVWKNAMEKVEFLETVGSVTGLTYPVWRAVKRNNLWAFYAQQEDLSWELFDSTICIDPTMLGITLRDHVSQQAKPLKVNKAVLCRGTHISVTNISNGDKVLLKSETGDIVRESLVPLNHSGVSIELPSIPFTGTIEIQQQVADVWVTVSVVEEVTEMYGGDVFVKGTDLKVKWRGEDLHETVPTQVGALKQGMLELDMILYNDNEFDIAENVEIRVAAYFDHFGWKWVDVAEDEGQSPGLYKDTISVGTLNPLSEKKFWVKIEVGDRNDPQYLAQRMRPTNFYLEVVNN